MQNCESIKFLWKQSHAALRCISILVCGRSLVRASKSRLTVTPLQLLPARVACSRRAEKSGPVRTPAIHARAQSQVARRRMHLAETAIQSTENFVGSEWAIRLHLFQRDDFDGAGSQPGAGLKRFSAVKHPSRCEDFKSKSQAWNWPSQRRLCGPRALTASARRLFKLWDRLGVAQIVSFVPQRIERCPLRGVKSAGPRRAGCGSSGGRSAHLIAGERPRLRVLRGTGP
jgi:hypothetical protein